MPHGRLSSILIGCSLLLAPLAAWAEPFALLASAKGKVEVLPSRGGAPVRATFGRALERGDKVMVGAGGAAAIYFSDGNVIELSEKSAVTVGGRVGNKSGAAGGGALPGAVYAQVSRVVTGGSRETGLVALAQMRSAEDHGAFLLEPRNAELLGDRPTFTWKAVDGAARYRVRVSGPEGELWTRETKTPRLDYPADAPALARDADFLWNVTALGERGRIREEEVAFRVASEEAAGAVRADVKRISESAGGADHAATHFLAGSYLQGRGLYHDAAEHFVALSRIEPGSPAPHEALGNVYRAMGLMEQAATEYQRALELSKP